MRRGFILLIIFGLLVSGLLMPLFFMENIVKSSFVKDESVLVGVSPDGKGWLVDYNGQLILFLSGNGYEMGYQQGYLLKEEIERSINGYVYGGRELNGNPPKALQILYAAQEPYIPQRYKEEMQGIADASGIPLIDIQAYNVKSDKGPLACRQIALWGNATVDGNLYHARSLGYPINFRDEKSGVALQDQSIVIIAKPEGYYPFVSIAWPGSVGGVTGMNIKGISLAINDVLSTDTTPYGMTRTFRLRKVLEEAKNIDEAIHILNESKTVGWCMCLGDGKIPEAYGVEMNGNLFYAGPWNDPVEYYNDDCEERGFPPYEPLDGCVIRFGHMYRDPRLAETRLSPKTGEPADYSCQSEHYYKHIQMIIDHYGEWNANLLNNLLYELADPVAANLHLVILSSSTLDFKVSNAIGSKPAQYFPSYSMNLDVLANIKPPQVNPSDIPTVHITFPEGGSIIHRFQNKVTIKGIASDDTKISQVYIKVDGEDYELANGRETWEKTIDTSSWERGSWHRIKVLAVDESGNGDIDIIGLKKAGISNVIGDKHFLDTIFDNEKIYKELSIFINLFKRM